MDNQCETAQFCSDIITQFSITISDFSDEILLNILRFVPSHDLIFNVSRVCRKLWALCRDKSLVSCVSLRKEYTATDEAVKCLLKELSGDIQTLDASGCYWLPGSTLDHLTRCVGLVRLDASGWRMTPSRLSRLLGSLPSLQFLGLDIRSGFDLQQLSADGKSGLARLCELKQTLLTPSYGVLPCCSSLQSLSLYLEVAEGCHEPTGYLQLMVGQSSIPRYHNLRWFSAHLAPGEVNYDLLNLYLAAFSLRLPEGMSGLVVAIPGPAPPMGAAATAVTNMALRAGSAITAFQLPRAWLNGDTLRRVLACGCPAYLNVARCAMPGFKPLCVLLGASHDLTPMRTLSLRGKGEDEVNFEDIRELAKLCPRLARLNLSSMHYHHSATEKHDRHLCGALGCFTHVLSLALPACALAPRPPVQGNKSDLCPLSSESLLLGLKKSRRIGVAAYQPVLDGAAVQKDGQEDEAESCMRPLLKGCRYLEELELIGTGFLSAMPRNEPAMRKDLAACPWSCQIGDAQLAALGRFRFLRRLTLAHLPGVLKGTGLIQLFQGCKDVHSLSLSNLGTLKTVNYVPALLEALKHLTRLREFRLEQPYFSANAAFFEALSHCRVLQRLCLVSRQGTFQHAAAVGFVQHCKDVIMFHMFTGDTLVACRTLQKTLLDSHSASRPALNVVVYPLLHEDLGNVIKEMPLCHLDEITLFKSRVAEEPVAR